jgi:hypothetical protein
MSTYKRTDIDVDAVYNGFCFVDRDEMEVFVDTSDVEDMQVVGIGADGEEYFRVYVQDIPKFITTLQEAYNYSKGL